jgi:membrane protease YdiL (CAAX protease family)
VIPASGFSRLGERIPFFADHAIGREVAWWSLAAAMLVFVLAVERRSLSSIGFQRPTWRTFAFGAAAAIVCLVGLGLLLQTVFAYFHLQPNTAAYNQLASTPYVLRVAIVTRAAFCEEILMRGYGIERISELTGSRLLAGAITLAVFTYAHLAYWGWAHLMVAGSAGLVLTILYLWRRDLWSNILAHWLVDGAGLLIPH